MSNEPTSHIPLDPLDMWRQWNTAASQLWVQAMNNGKESTTQPLDMYRAWTTALAIMQERMMSSPQPLLDPREAWKMWLDITMDIWRGAAASGGDPRGIIRGWVSVMEDMQKRIRSGEGTLVDPFTLLRQWYDAMSGQWSKLAEDVLTSEQFYELTGPFVESYTSLVRAFRRASEQYFNALQLPTTADTARVAKLVIALEEKVDTIEDAIERIEDRASAETMVAVTQHFGDLEQRLLQVEGKLDRLLSLFEESRDQAEGASTTTQPRTTTSRKKRKENEDHQDAK